MTDNEHTSRNRREQSINIKDIQDEIKREREKMAAKAAEPEADVKPEDLVLFKERAAKKVEAAAAALAVQQAEAKRVLAEKEAKKAAKLAKKQGKTPEEIKSIVSDAAKAAESDDQPKSKLFKPLDEDEEITRLDTANVDPVGSEFQETTTALKSVEQPGMSWNKFFKMSRAKQATIVFGIGLPVLAVIGTALWFTRGWREWTGNLVVIAIPLLLILTYVLDHFAQDKYWQDFRGHKILNRANRQDAAIVIPLILFMATLSLNSDMFFMDGFIHFFRFVFIGAIVWAGLIWLTRKVPPIRKMMGEE